MRTDLSTDQQLLERYRHKGDTGALGTLFLRYRELIYGVCLKYLGQPESARDAVMDIYEHISRKLPGHQVEHFSGWLYQVSKNHCLQALRRKNNVLTVSLDDPVMQNGRELHQEDDHPDWDAGVDIADALHDCIDHLTEHQQTCIRLFYFEKKSYQDICEVTGLSMDHVRSHIQNGRRNLKKCLQQKQKLGSGTDI